MPWVATDADKHHKGLTAKQKRMWAAVANKALAAGDDEGTAIRKASGAVNKVVEAADLLGESMGGDLIEAASRLNMNDSHSAVRSKLSDVLYPTERYYAYIEDVFGDDSKGTVVYSANKGYWKRTYEKDGESYKLGDAVKVDRAYVNAKEAVAEAEFTIPDGEALVESEIATEPIALVEKAINRDGTTMIRLIGPGQGSSGYYPADVLKRDGPKIFTEGTKMFWDHDTEDEERNRPEGSLNRLAAVLTENCHYDESHPQGPGLYARAKVFKNYHDSLNELAPHIGVSIRAMGEAANGQVAGKPTRIIRSIKARKSVDFVTSPGAGGRVLQLFEAARSRETQTEEVQENAMTPQELEQFQESQRKVASLETTVSRLLKEATLREGAGVVRVEITTLGKSLPKISLDKILESAGSAIITKADGTLDVDGTKAAAKKLVEAEVAYVAGLLKTGTVVNLGESAPPAEQTPEKLDAGLKEAFTDLGYGGTLLDSVARGRE